MEIKDYFKNSQKIKKEFDLINKDRDRIFVTGKPLLRDEITELEDLERELAQKSELVSRGIFSGVSRIKRQASEVSKKLQNFVESTKTQGISSDYDHTVSSLQKAADLVNLEILDFKEKSRLDYEELLQSEKILSNEIEYFSNKFNQWESEVPRVTKPSIKNITEPENLPPLKQELISIDKEIQETGGQYLGWDEVDHAEFLKLWTKHKGKVTQAFIQASASILPLHDLDSIREHAQKYQLWLSLNDKKKDVLSKWREEKKNMKTVEDVQILEKKTVKRPQSAFEAKKKLEEWRINREKMKEEENNLKIEENAKKLEENLRRKAEIEDKRQLVLEYKEKKEFEKAKSKLISEYVKKRDVIELSEDDKRRLKEREDRIIEQKRLRTLEKMKSKEEKNRQESMSKLKTQAQWSHVDSKLTQETFSVMARRESKDQKKEIPSTFGGMLVHRPTRAVPTWRVGL
jgi:hypothetical protein